MNRISILLAVCCSQLLHGNSSFQPTFTFQVTRGEFNDTVRVRQNRQMKGEKFCKRMNGIYNSSHTCICVHPTPLLTSTKSGTLDFQINILTPGTYLKIPFISYVNMKFKSCSFCQIEGIEGGRKLKCK